jgi:hypothetical protein
MPGSQGGFVLSARFWVWWNDGWIKLTLGNRRRSVSFGYRGFTEEGSVEVSLRYKLEGDFVTREYYRWESDCDGPHEHHEEARCHIMALHYNCMPDDGILSPNWRKVSRSQRDHYAETMGY